jgi:hypothetical protein
MTDTVDLQAVNQDIEVMFGDSLDLSIQVLVDNGNPADLSIADIYFKLAYSEDTFSKPILDLKIGDTRLYWKDIPKCIFNLHLNPEDMASIKFPLRQPNKVSCKYAIGYVITGFGNKVASRTLYVGNFIIHRK